MMNSPPSPSQSHPQTDVSIWSATVPGPDWMAESRVLPARRTLVGCLYCVWHLSPKIGLQGLLLGKDHQGLWLQYVLGLGDSPGLWPRALSGLCS